MGRDGDYGLEPSSPLFHHRNKQPELRTRSNADGRTVWIPRLDGTTHLFGGGSGESGAVVRITKTIVGASITIPARRSGLNAGRATSSLHHELHPEIDASRMEIEAPKTQRGDPTQSLARAIRILEVVAEGPISLPGLTERLSLPRSTVYRLATALVENGLLETSGRSGYRMGIKMYELGSAYASPAGPPIR